VSPNITTAEVIGTVKSITGNPIGPTAQVTVGSMFSRGGGEDFEIGGVFRFSGLTGATGATFAVSDDSEGLVNEFFSDALLDGAGFTVKGASGDKTFTYETGCNAFVTNVNLGVNTENQFVTSRFYRNCGLDERWQERVLVHRIYGY
jgi:hypothetical protein